MKLKIASLSDIHLGHSNTSTSSIIRNLDNNFIAHPEFKDLDIIFIAGDLFDRLLAHDDPNRPEIYLWFVRLCEACAKHDIMVRILEGTPSHDWKQSEILPTIHLISKLPINLVYVKTLSVEYIETIDSWVLYIPDEWRTTSEETLNEARELLKAKGLSKVDFCVMHGCFEYQLPKAARSVSTHSEEAYLDMVKHLIFIGHHHTHTRYERIVAQGSFDRLRHGEEEAKGFVIANVDTEANTREVYFIENKDARVYKTIDCTYLSAESIIEKLKTEILSLPNNSAVRIVAEKNNEIFSDMSPLVRLAPTIIWSTQKLKEQDDEDLVDAVTAADQVYKAVSVTADNIVSLMMDRPKFSQATLTIQENAIRHLRDLL